MSSFSSLGFAGVLQVVMGLLFVIIGVTIVYWQKSIGTAIVEIILISMGIMNLLIAQSAAKFVTDVATEAPPHSPAVQMQILEHARSASRGYWSLAALACVFLVALGIFAAWRGKRLGPKP